MRRLVAIGFIWLGCAVAWMILGSTVVSRSGESSAALNGEVRALWGPTHMQRPPQVVWSETVPRREKVTSYTPQGNAVENEVTRQITVEHTLPLDETRLDVRLDMQQRQKGLLWFPTYTVELAGSYAFVNDGPARVVELRFPLAEAAIYDEFALRGADGRELPARIERGVASVVMPLAAKERREIAVRYRSRGVASWTYELTDGSSQVRNFHLHMDANVREVDFPVGSLSPTQHERDGRGWHGDWRFGNLIARAPIGVELPQRTNPGPLAARITFFAPVGLLFFFFVVAQFAAVRRRELHPLNYFFFGTAFFAFHLLFSYLVDHVSLFVAFGVAAQVSILLVVTYARLFVGWRFALYEMGLSQLVYLVLFSFTFLWQGFTGLSITVGAILTLAVMMQVTGRAELRKRLQTNAAQLLSADGEQRRE